MDRRTSLLPLTAMAVGLLALGGGCTTTDAAKTTGTPKKPDVTQDGVLPPPQLTMKPSAGAAAPVIPAGGVAGGVTAPPGGLLASLSGAPAAPAAPAAGGLTMPKFSLKPEKKVVPAEFAVAWQNKIEYLPDPTRNGALGAGLVGQMFIYGGWPKYEPADANGVLTVDLIDETPRLPGQPAAVPERWQFSKEMLRNLRTVDDRFGRSYVLFLPWPSYRPDIVRVRLAARFDPEAGHTLFTPPSAVTITTEAPVWDASPNRGQPPAPAGPVPGPQSGPFAGFSAPQTQVPAGFGMPIPIGGAGNGAAPFAGAAPPGGMSFGAPPANTVPPGGMPFGVPPAGGAGQPFAPTAPVAPLGASLPQAPVVPPAAVVPPAPSYPAPGGVMPLAPLAPERPAGGYPGR
jgi:hypothetical protein